MRLVGALSNPWWVPCLRPACILCRHDPVWVSRPVSSPHHDQASACLHCRPGRGMHDVARAPATCSVPAAAASQAHGVACSSRRACEADWITSCMRASCNLHSRHHGISRQLITCTRAARLAAVCLPVRTASRASLHRKHCRDVCMRQQRPTRLIHHSNARARSLSRRPTTRRLTRCRRRRRYCRAAAAG